MGVQVPLGHTLTYMLTGHARGRETPQARTLPIIDGHGLISIWQEHDIPLRILGLCTRKRRS